MEKVKLTQEQAEAIKFALNTERLAYYQDPDALLKSHIRSRHFLHELEPLGEIDSVTLAKALYVGYEIETFKVGDWITFDKYTGKVLEVSGGSVLTDIKGPLGGANQRFRNGLIRIATPEEIAAEKERRKWEAIGRDVNEYLIGDIVMFKGDDSVYEVLAFDLENPNRLLLENRMQLVDKDEISLVCPVEQRFDMKEES